MDNTEKDLTRGGLSLYWKPQDDTASVILEKLVSDMERGEEDIAVAYPSLDRQ